MCWRSEFERTTQHRWHRHQPDAPDLVKEQKASYRKEVNTSEKLVAERPCVIEKLDQMDKRHPYPTSYILKKITLIPVLCERMRDTKE